VERYDKIRQVGIIDMTRNLRLIEKLTLLCPIALALPALTATPPPETTPIYTDDDAPR
jgi:hypothetical protein